jgi:cytochrome b6-f complex iron-sulfur subunit
VSAPVLKLESPVNGQTRREFCQRVCQMASIAAVGSLVSACGGGGGPTSPTDIGSSLPVVGGSRGNGVTTVNIAPGSPLASTGGMALVQAGAVDFLVTRTGDTSFIALTAICTHQQCTVSNFSGSLFVCPCHGSEYTTSGSVARGPAGAPLRTFATQFADPLLTING